MELGRIVELVQGDQYLFIRRRWLTGIFVLGDVVSFLMQAGGKHYYVSRQIYVCPVLRGSYRIRPEATEMRLEEEGRKRKTFQAFATTTTYKLLQLQHATLYLG